MNVLVNCVCAGAGTTGSNVTLSTSNIPIFLSELQCDSSVDSYLLDCNSRPYGRPSIGCSHEDDVWVHCEGMVIYSSDITDQ